MAIDNTITVSGNVTRDPDIRFTNAGQGVATIGVAVNRRYQQNGEWTEEVSFFNVTAWGTLGENAATCLRKGARIVVTGRLQQRAYETQEGEKRNAIEIIADDIGASLRWATVEITRIERTQGSTPAASKAASTPANDEPFLVPADHLDLMDDHFVLRGRM